MHADDYLTINEIAERESLDAGEVRHLVDTHGFIVPGVRTVEHPETGEPVVRANDYEKGLLRENLPWTRSEPTDILAIGVRDDIRVLTAWSSLGGLDYDDPREIVSLRAGADVIDALGVESSQMIRVPGHRNVHLIGRRRLAPADHFDMLVAPLGNVGIDIRFTYIDCEIETGWRDNYPGGSTTELPYREIGGW